MCCVFKWGWFYPKARQKKNKFTKIHKAQIWPCLLKFPVRLWTQLLWSLAFPRMLALLQRQRLWERHDMQEQILPCRIGVQNTKPKDSSDLRKIGGQSFFYEQFVTRIHSSSVIRVSSSKGPLVKILAKIEVSINTWLVKLCQLRVTETRQNSDPTAPNDIHV